MGIGGLRTPRTRIGTNPSTTPVSLSILKRERSCRRHGLLHIGFTRDLRCLPAPGLFGRVVRADGLDVWTGFLFFYPVGTGPDALRLLVEMG